MKLQTRHGVFDFSSRAYIMGIVNITPDSFYDGGAYDTLERAAEHAVFLAGHGADILDIGGESTRPGAETVPLHEELERVVPAIREIRRRVSIPLSIDTRKAAVARAALEEGADLINDISGLKFDPDMPGIAALFNCPVIVMHMQGTPGTMQIDPKYDDVIKEIRDYFLDRIKALQCAGISESNILLDPGIGFGKRLKDNLLILNRLDSFSKLGFPLVVGPSRKRFIGDVLGLPVSERLEGTSAAVAAAILRGANIVRVHDVREIKRVVKMIDAIMHHDMF